MKHNHLIACVMALAAVLQPWSSVAQDQTNFGSRERSEAALIGTFYDLKQTQQRGRTRVSPKEYPDVVQDFISHRWDESILNRYFRSGRSLYTTQIYIPVMNADDGPKAFDLGSVVKPGCWIVHYKGQVSPPADGTYRFVGFADDLIAVAVDEQTVLESVLFHSDWVKPPDQIPQHKAGSGNLTYGNWIDLKKNQIINLDVIIGERPGGQFCAFLLYQRKGEPYEMQGGKFPVLPLFQLTPIEIPFFAATLAPRVAKTGETWKGRQ